MGLAYRPTQAGELDAGSALDAEVAGRIGTSCVRRLDAAGAMALSSVFVVSNALRLRGFTPPAMTASIAAAAARPVAATLAAAE